MLCWLPRSHTGEYNALGFFLFNQRVWNELINHIIEDFSPLSTVHICKRYTLFLFKGVLILSYDSIWYCSVSMDIINKYIRHCFYFFILRDKCIGFIKFGYKFDVKICSPLMQQHRRYFDINFNHAVHLYHIWRVLHCGTIYGPCQRFN